MTTPPVASPTTGTSGPPVPAAPSAPAQTDWLAKVLRPRVVLPVLAVVMLVAILFTPEAPSTNLDLRLTTTSAGPAGAKGLYEVMGRLGWSTRRRMTAFNEPLDSDAVYAVFGGPRRMTAAEVHVLLDAVRRGAGLIYVVEDRPLTDSLVLRHSSAGGSLAVSASDSSRCQPQALQNTLLWLGAGVHLYYLVDSLSPTSNRERLPADTAVFVSVTHDGESSSDAGGTLPAVAGYPLGRGRVVAVSDPDALRNDVVRVCRVGVGPRLVAAIEYASQGRRPPLVFDEYHQSNAAEATPVSTAVAFLGAHPVGRAILQLLAGGLVLILALGVRALAPHSMPAIERRSPLEHVDALALAYERIHASRTAVTRLVRGLRRRHDRGGWSSRAAGQTGTEDANDRFLTAVAASHPRLAPDVKRVEAAERTTVEPSELLEVAAAIDRIDRAFPGNRDRNHHSKPY